MTEQIKWAEPPSDGRARRSDQTDWSAIADALRARPGEWALIQQDVSTSVASQVRRGYYKGFTPGEFEAVSRSRAEYSKWRGDIYARYIGTEAVSA
ncbi:MAG TPA: hypothetical protein VFH56_12355 [Acidimicrobiales bacterium]|nr:hypothetical protein [Acidimicrobiales bacterium]